MNEQHFSLQPFSPPGSQPATANPWSDFKISGNLARHANRIAIRYELLGSLEKLLISPRADQPSRQDELWEETCFEFFLGLKDSSRYWEFNLSTAGHWNVYRFSAYRQGMQAETAFTSLPFGIQYQSDVLRLILNLDLARIAQADQELRVAISTVLKHNSGEVSYWALTHPGLQADFHRQDSFIITL